MEHVNPEFFQDFFTVSVAILALIFLIMRILRASKRSPSLDSELTEIRANLESILKNQSRFESSLAQKRDKSECDRMFRDLEKDVKRIDKRVDSQDERINNSLGKIHKRIDTVATTTSELNGKMDLLLKNIGGK